MDGQEDAPEALQGAACVRRLIETRDELLGFVYAQVRDWAVAEDILQDVSVVVLEKAQEGVAVTHFRAWSHEIARRLVRQYWRSCQRQPLCLSEEALVKLEEAFARRETTSRPVGPELRTRLREAMVRLPARVRELLEMFYDEQLPQREIAARLGSSEGAVQVAICRARQRLLEMTEGEA